MRFLAVQAGGLFGYRFQYPAMRVGRHELYWHRPLVAYMDSSGKPCILPDGPAGYLTAYEAERLHTLTSVGLGVGQTFQYVFDFGDGWEHRCTVLRDDVDPVAECGSVPNEIVPIFGWGTIPDQYGRSSAAQDETE